MWAALSLVMGATSAPLAYRVAPVWAEIGVHAPGPAGLVDGRLVVARGERESFFVVLLPRGPKVELEVRVSALTAEEASLPPDVFRVFRAHYVDARGVGPLADALVPLERGELRDRYHPEAAPLPLLVELDVPVDARPGEYRGVLVARVGEEESEIPLTVEIADVLQPAVESPVGPPSLAPWLDVELGAPRSQLRAAGWGADVDLRPVASDAAALRWDAARRGLWYPAGVTAEAGALLESARLHVVRDGREEAALVRLAQARGLAVAARWQRLSAATDGDQADLVAQELARREVLRTLASSRVR